jgi:hypothetical protein
MTKETEEFPYEIGGVPTAWGKKILYITDELEIL